MTTRALEDNEIQAIFNCVGGCHAKRNETMLIVGIGMALRASELVGLNVGDVYGGEKVKSYVTIRAETAKFNKERTIRIGDGIQNTIADLAERRHRSYVGGKLPSNIAFCDISSGFGMYLCRW